MSQWVKLKTEIKDLGMFRKECEKLGITVAEEHDRVNLSGAEQSHAYLTRVANGGWVLNMDQDAGYSAFARIYGSKAEKIMQPYSIARIRRTVTRAGHAVRSQTTDAHNVVTLRIVTT